MTRIHFATQSSSGSFELGDDDYIVSSLPLALMTHLLKKALPEKIPTLAQKVVTLNDLLLVFLHVDKPDLVKESWVFIPDPAIAFHRLSEQESFDPSMTPNGSIVCCEIMSSDTRHFAQKTDEELIADSLKGLADMGYSDFAVKQQRVIRLPKSYPVFQPNYEKGLQEILSHLDSFTNLRTVGRQGAFNYIGTMDAMDIGYGVARWLADDRKDSWALERERTNHYPVLD